MASQGPLNPGAGTSGSPGSIPWVNPGNIAASDDSRAVSALLLLGDTTETLAATTFGFSIPSTATIDGIVLEIERSATSLSTAQDSNVQLLQGGSPSGDNKASVDLWPTTDAYKTYGSSSDLWGLSWAPSDINSSGFGAVVQATDTDAVASDARVDHIRITVYYTPTTTTHSLAALGVGG